MNDSVKIAQMEQFIICQLNFNKKVIKILDKVHKRFRNSYEPLECTDDLKEIINNQGEMIKWMSQ